MKKRLCVCLSLIAVLGLTACVYDSEKLARENQKEHEEKCEKVLEEMERRLSEKYSDALGNDPDDIVFDAYDLTKGGHQAWFMGGFYPATAVYEGNDEEFTVQIEVPANVKDFGDMEDSFYGVLYGEDVKEELYDLVESYGVEDIKIYYEPCGEILTDEADLKKQLTVFGEIKIESSDDLDTVCDLADELMDFGCNNRISADGYDLYKKSGGIGGMTSDEVREFFEG